MINHGNNFLVIEADGVNDFYKDALDSIIERGYEISPRGKPTKEVRPVMLIINKPRERFLTCPGRFIHPYFQVMESIWILGGRGDVELVSYYLKNIEKYSDGKGHFNAPYGTRMRRWGIHRDHDSKFFRDQFADCFHLLLKQPSTRQAVMVFWNPFFDHLHVDTDDRPCNIAFQFLIRKGELDLVIMNRSNDLTYGLCNANVVQFSVILETMWMLLNGAGLEVSLGREIHFINSLHVYDFQSDINKNVLGKKYQYNVYEHFKGERFGFDPKNKDFSLIKFQNELDVFFKIEDQIRRFGSISISLFSDLSFNFLKDACFLAESFYYYKRKDYDFSVGSLLGVNSLDIFISCLEFLSRKASWHSRVGDAFKKKLLALNLYNENEESIIETERFIKEH